MPDATADFPGPSVPRSCGSREALASIGARGSGAAAPDDAALRSGSGMLDDAVTLGAGGLVRLGVGGGSDVVTSRAGAAGGVGGTTGSSSTGTGTGFRAATAGAGRGRCRETTAGGAGMAGGRMSAGSRSSHTTRADGGAASPAEPAATTIIPNPRWIAIEHASGRTARISTLVGAATLNDSDDIPYSLLISASRDARAPFIAGVMGASGASEV